ncbi:hypothetical protein C5167_011344 [Papaver somniferum]|uniref:Tail specific protease domain-containing protein n=1 Tax=Papaver somniferum TaxID=3469 RepID=A0A4Y7K2R0_PAPSO|nr:hypothetical protein C5167_011344 [Papaver somniferum]
MRTLCYHHWSSLTLAERTPKPPLPPKSNIRQQPHKLLFHALTGTLSFNLIFLSPSPSIAQLISPPPPPVEYCKEEDVLEQEKPQTVPGLVTNQGIVEEAWEIVNESFLDYSDRPRFSPDNWLKKKEDAIGSSIQTRSKAHDIIQRMLGSLGDPYTRFLSPSEVIYTAGRDPQYQKSIVAESAPAFTAPLIVLVNNKTASASEIVSCILLII